MVEAMQSRGATKQHALAYALGVNESTITRWKNNGPMSVDHVVQLCRELDISLDWFLNGTGSMHGHRQQIETIDSAETKFRASLQRAEAVMTDHSKSLLVAFIDSILPDNRTI